MKAMCDIAVQPIPESSRYAEVRKRVNENARRWLTAANLFAQSWVRPERGPRQTGGQSLRVGESCC